MSNDKMREALTSLMEAFTNPESGEIDRNLALKDAQAALSASEGAAPVAYSIAGFVEPLGDKLHDQPTSKATRAVYFRDILTTPQPAVNGAGLSDDVRRARLIAIEAQRFADDRTHLGAMVYVNDLAWALRILAAAVNGAGLSDAVELFREAISWGYVYGPQMSDEQRDRLWAEQARNLARRLTAPAAPPAEAAPLSHELWCSGVTEQWDGVRAKAQALSDGRVKGTADLLAAVEELLAAATQKRQP